MARPPNWLSLWDVVQLLAKIDSNACDSSDFGSMIAEVQAMPKSLPDPKDPRRSKLRRLAYIEIRDAVLDGHLDLWVLGPRRMSTEENWKVPNASIDSAAQWIRVIEWRRPSLSDSETAWDISKGREWRFQASDVKSWLVKRRRTPTNDFIDGLPVDPVKNGAPGRPSIMHLVLRELERRGGEGLLNDTLAAQARELHAWCHTIDGGPGLKVTSIANGIRTRFKELKLTHKNRCTK